MQEPCTFSIHDHMYFRALSTFSIHNHNNVFVTLNMRLHYTSIVTLSAWVDINGTGIVVCHVQLQTSSFVMLHTYAYKHIRTGLGAE